MYRLDHRVVRALLGALALYLIWHAVAPPFDGAGTPAQARMLMAFIAAVVIAGLTVPFYMTAGSPALGLATVPGPRIRAHRPRPWRTRIASVHPHADDPHADHAHADHAHLDRAHVDRAHSVYAHPPQTHMSGASTIAATSTSTSTTTTTVRRGLPDHVLVICDGTSAGDSACRLAQRLAERRQAVVRAVAILPENVRDARPVPGDPGPIERFLDDVNEQMRRATPMPAAWGLTLIVHDVENELRRACAEFDVDTILVPSSLRTPDGDVLHAASAAVEGTVRTLGRGAPLIVVVAEQSATPVAPAEMHSASLRPDTAALATLSARPEPVSPP